MTSVNKTNNFFKKNVYSNLANFALSPVGWAFKAESHGSMFATADFGKLILAAFLAPVLIPATIATSAIAFCLVGIAALFHGLSLLIAGIVDCFSNTSDRATVPSLA